jgi:hypothetical protein
MAQQSRWLARELMVLPIAINSVITTHSQMNKRTSTFGSPLSSPLVAHPPRVLNETNSNDAERWFKSCPRY